MELNEIKKKLSENLRESRYSHTLGVAYTSASMAMAFGEDIQKAFMAGLLHDCAKGYSLEQQVKLCRKYGITLTKERQESPQLLHSALAPYIARDCYGNEDPEIASAVECHTTGKPAMTVLDKIVFIADYIEPGRKEIPGLSNVRQLAFSDMDQCLLKILEHTIQYLQGREQTIDPKTMETYQYYKEEDRI
ncbi:bis(5'-nucleosyl)-tetraphosphatase (symmetrical) YqeK [Anaerostipes sp.]|uniref:bis(5'-nucleosyl)-tetraphosphatase (symmetrical) YqeK n=1 Tax=Anaerostipes sp. TaxID=1872530 RepID=UPI0025BA0F9E|nr:bis(5'-nucleosyl)-tetraphosphatase (symmetrical) YqeK [Anaerostipes sp.]MBS7008733.1 bis(5'-nucleosyl)-tetraphosphatase (symmetrical) YqeK [Anaerostipes sp.]